MYLKRIEIQGFKSFADPVTIDFKEGVTCIVGPNGSGKSNISDAMRWVLGEQSAKTLRGSKMEEIIFAGTDSRRAKGMAEVVLVFDNTSHILDIDYSEVALKRRLFRSGESEYFINDNLCRLRDIRELIMDTGIGVDGYSFIGQGRVDKIVSDKPESRREIFEEAAGIIKYKSRCAEAERKLESAGANLVRLGDLISDIESRIDGLREESEKAKEYQTLSKRYRELEINITLKNIEGLQTKNRELALQFKEADERLEKLRGDKAETDARLEGLRARDDELETRATGLREKLALNQTRSLHIANAAAITEERLKNISKDKVRLDDEIARVSENAAERAETLAEFEDNHVKYSRILDEFAPQLADLLSDAAAKEQIYSEKALNIDNKKSTLFELSRERSAKEAELSSGEGLAANFDDTEAAIKNEMGLAGTERAALTERAEALVKDAEVKAEKTEALDKKQESLRADYSGNEKAQADNKLRLEATRIEAEKKRSRQKTIEEMESNYEGYAAGVRALMQNRQSGVIGVVTELIKVASGFEAAIETALGSATQNIVTEDDIAAKKAIGFLKENRAGRLTFLPMRSIKANAFDHDMEMEKIQGFAGYATDCISYEKKYEEVFMYLLGRTIVADTLDDAIKMSVKNTAGWKIVTKDGEVVSPAGALTGGVYKHKTANLLERRNEIESLRKEIAGLDASENELRKSVEELARESQKLLADIRETDMERRNAETELVRALEEKKTVEYMLSETDKLLERRKAELGGVLKDRESSADMIAALRGDIEILTAKITDISIEIETDIAGLPYVKEISDEARTAATELRLKAAEAGRDKENADRTLGSMRADLEQIEARLEALKKERAELDILPAESAGDISSDEITKLSEEKISLDMELKTVLEERQEVRIQIEEGALSESRSYDRIEAQISSKNGMEVELGRQEMRLQTWKEKLFDEFELSYVHALEYKTPNFVMTNGIKENRDVKERLREIGDVNPGSIREYEEVSERYTFLVTQRDDVVASMRDFQAIVRDMNKISTEKFRETFEQVSEIFGETFALLFGGGRGQILLEDENDPLECGIDIKISPPGKTNLASIDSYSGGEKSMIAIALLFSILRAKPTPFCILDEIDAALDESNIHRFANYVSGFEGTQFALVTHQRSTMEYANALFGVTMQEQGVTSVLSLQMGDKATEEFAEAL